MFDDFGGGVVFFFFFKPLFSLVFYFCVIRECLNVNQILNYVSSVCRTFFFGALLLFPGRLVGWRTGGCCTLALCPTLFAVQIREEVDGGVGTLLLAAD